MLSPCHKVAQIGGESGADSVSDSLIDSGVCVWRHGKSMCVLLFSFCVCVRLGPCHSVPGPRDLHAHLALTL